MAINAIVYQIAFAYWRSIASNGLYSNFYIGLFIAVICFFLYKQKRWAKIFYYILSGISIIYGVTAILVLVRKEIGPAFQDIPIEYIFSYIGMTAMHIVTLVILKLGK